MIFYRHTTRWCIGFVAAFLIAWGISAVFHDSLVPMVRDEELDRFIRMPGSTLRMRSEGWADTYTAERGLTVSGALTAASKGPKIIIWGDSHGEARQVESSQRMASIFNDLSDEVKAVSIADGGMSVADYFFLLPSYEKTIGDVVGHVFLLSGMEDVLPGMNLACRSRFLSDPWRIEKSECTPSNFALRFAPFLNRWRLDFLHGIYRDVSGFIYRNASASVTFGSGLEEIKDDDLEEGWTFLIQSLKGLTQSEIIFLYLPTIPRLDEGKIITVEGHLKTKERFRMVCLQNGVRFISLTDRFRDFFLVTNRFPRGFFNSPPGLGHLNADGQRIAGEELFQRLCNLASDG